MNQPAKYDFVVFGATGFTGQLVVDYLVANYSQDSQISWALAGRSQSKLEQIKKTLNVPDSVDLLVVDSNDDDSIKVMATRTKCVLTTVGPYQLYGDKIVAICAELGTDYVDLCGEPGWMHDQIAAHQNTAKKSGARIVFSCGFDSIPFDLGVFFLQQEVIRQHGKAASNIRGRVRVMDGEFSGGTAASLGATMASVAKRPELLSILINPFSLAEGFNGPEQPTDNKPLHDDKLDVWLTPFIMAPINTKNIHRSNFLLNHQYGEDFKYHEMWVSGKGDEGKAIAEMMAKINPLAGDNVPQPGEGPSKESRDNGSYDILFCADIEGQTIHAAVTGDMDPGYGSTSKMITESAICLVNECQGLEGGIYTPAPAMGEKLINRLVSNAGLTFSIEQS